MYRDRIEKVGPMNLSEDDRKWIAGQNEQLRTHIDGQNERLRVTLESYVDARFENMEARLENQREALIDMETKLLTEFHKWASPTELRISSHANAIRAIDIELGITKERVAKLEPKQ
jgi:hypothetical protein